MTERELLKTAGNIIVEKTIPVRIPLATAHCRASSAYALTLAASAKPLRSA